MTRQLRFSGQHTAIDVTQERLNAGKHRAPPSASLLRRSRHQTSSTSSVSAAELACPGMNARQGALSTLRFASRTAVAGRSSSAEMSCPVPAPEWRTSASRGGQEGTEAPSCKLVPVPRSLTHRPEGRAAPRTPAGRPRHLAFRTRCRGCRQQALSGPATAVKGRARWSRCGHRRGLP